MADLPRANFLELPVADVAAAQAFYRAAVGWAMTGFGQEEDRLRAQEAGFDRHLLKPVDLCELEALLAQVEWHELPSRPQGRQSTSEAAA